MISSDKPVAHMYIESVISISDRTSAQCEGKDVSSQSHFAIPLLICDLGPNRKIPLWNFVMSSESPGPKR